MEDQNLNQPNLTEENVSQQVFTTSPSSTQNVPINQPKRRLIKLIIFAVLGILLMILIFGGGYIFAKNQLKRVTQTPTPAVSQTSTSIPVSNSTSDWKTYTGNYFTIKYPEGWSINDQSYNSGGQIYIGFAANAPLRSDVTGANGKNAYYLQVVKYDTGSEALAPNSAYGSTGEEFVFQKEPGDQAVNEVPVSSSYIESSTEHTTAAKILSTFKLTH